MSDRTPKEELRASHESSREVLQVRAGLVPRKTERDCWLRARTCADDTGIARGRDCQCANHERSGEQRARPSKRVVQELVQERCSHLHLTALSGWAARSDRWLLLFAPHAQLAAPKLTPVDRCCACSSRRRNGEAEAAHRGEEDAERSEEGLGALNSTTGPRPALRRYAGDSKNCRPLSRPLSQSGHPRNATRPLPAL